MGIMGQMNSKDALGKDQHNGWAHQRIAKKDTHFRAGLVLADMCLQSCENVLNRFEEMNANVENVDSKQNISKRQFMSD